MSSLSSKVAHSRTVILLKRNSSTGILLNSLVLTVSWSKKINIIFIIVINIIITIIIIMITINNMITVIWKSVLSWWTKAKWLKWFVGSKNVLPHVENQLHRLIMSCDTRLTMWLVRGITQTQNYSGCNGNYINFYSKLVPKVIMTELFKNLVFGPF